VSENDGLLKINFILTADFIKTSGEIQSISEHSGNKLFMKSSALEDKISELFSELLVNQEERAVKGS